MAFQLGALEHENKSTSHIQAHVGHITHMPRYRSPVLQVLECAHTQSWWQLNFSSVKNVCSVRNYFNNLWNGILRNSGFNSHLVPDQAGSRGSLSQMFSFSKPEHSWAAGCLPGYTKFTLLNSTIKRLRQPHGNPNVFWLGANLDNSAHQILTQCFLCSSSEVPPT